MRRSASRGKSSSSSAAALLFSRVDASGEYVGMSNNSGKSANLSGWVLRAPHHGITFEFPDVQLADGASFYVTSGPEEDVARANPAKGDQVGRWPQPVPWSFSSEEGESDLAELVSPAGIAVASVAVEPRTPGEGRSVMELQAANGHHRNGSGSSPEVVAGGAAAAADKGCVVM
jgi:hypothetical protein